MLTHAKILDICLLTKETVFDIYRGLPVLAYVQILAYIQIQSYSGDWG